MRDAVHVECSQSERGSNRMSAMQDNVTDWQTEAVKLRRDQQMATAEIAERFGKSASQVRKVIAQANAERHVNGTGPAVKEPESQGDIERAVEKPEDPLHAFKQEAGEAVGDMPKTETETPVESETRMKGTRQTCLDFGVNSCIPTGGTLVVKSEKMASGHFEPGDIITGTFTARITKFGYDEKFDDASEEWRAKPVPYVATITEISVETA